MNTDLYKHLKQFVKEHDWNIKNVRKQSKAMFTTICCLENIEHDTYESDVMLLELYDCIRLKDNKEFDEKEFDDFENFMYEDII